MSALIELRNISKSFYQGELETQVLHGIDLQIDEGEFVAIMGASGSGKSTLMNIIGCLDKPTKGQFLFKGEDVAQFSRDELAALRREAFGFVFQSYNLLPGLSASENVEMPATYSDLNSQQRQARAAQLLSNLGLAERLHYKPNQLSGGQQQRVSIARALMNGGQIILADEPTGALDSQSGKDVMALLKDLSGQGYTIILITHDAKVAAHAHRLIEISDGRIVQQTAVPQPEQSAALVNEVSHGEPSLYSELSAGIKTAIRSLSSNVFRTILTLLGIVIGVASVISMLAIGDGAKQEIVDKISAMGSNLLLVRPGGPNQRGGRWSVSTLVPADVDALNTLPNILAAIPELTGSYTMRYETEDHSAEVNATSHLFPVARQWTTSFGTFFTEDDEQTYATVAVLGKTVAEKLFDQQDPLGRYLKIGRASCRERV